MAAEWSALAEQVLDSQSRGEDLPSRRAADRCGKGRLVRNRMPPQRARRSGWSPRGTISRAEDARDMLRVPQSFDLQQAEWARADYTRAGFTRAADPLSRGEGGLSGEVVE